METIAITGGTGLIGRALTSLLVSKNYRVVVFTRHPKTDTGDIHFAKWDPATKQIDNIAFSQADHIIHLAGEGVADKRWTRKRKRDILNSRVDGGNLITESINTIPNKIQTVVSASGIGWYGPDRQKNTAFTEPAPAYNDFLGQTCVQWEQSVAPVVSAGKRLVILRTGIVLSNEGGALVEFRKPLRAGIASILGSGKQVVSWIHIADICRAYLAAIENKHMTGVYNAVAPEPVTNKRLILAIARATNKIFLPVHVPEFVLKTVLGEMSIEVLKSATVDSTKIRNAGFNFIYPSLDAALNQLVRR